MNVLHAELVSTSAQLTQLLKVISTPLMQNFAQTVVHAQKFVRLNVFLLQNKPVDIEDAKARACGLFLCPKL